MVELTAKTMVIVQQPGSIVRRKGRCAVTLNDSGLTALYGRKAVPFVNVGQDSLVSASLVETLKGRGSSFTPFRGVILQLEIRLLHGSHLVGIVVPREEADSWLEAAQSALGSTL